MVILGIETSCDETAAAVVENGKNILSNIVASSADLHAKTGGIIPEQAAREQIKSIIPVINESLQKAFGVLEIDEYKNKIDAIAVTAGPGLIGSLLVGVETAKTLACFWGKPIVPVNHLTAHIYANWISKDTPLFPALALVVSGGHTDLVLMENHDQITWIGGTRDDAAGEAFDKTARLLGLSYPGGPQISVLAKEYREKFPQEKLTLFPRPLRGDLSFDWSFSGLKTAVLRHTKTNYPQTKEELMRLCAEVEAAIIDVLVEKTLLAIKKYPVASFVLGGGVAANPNLRERFSLRIKAEQPRVRFHVPVIELCSDNAVSIASNGYFNYKPKPWKSITAYPELAIV